MGNRSAGRAPRPTWLERTAGLVVVACFAGVARAQEAQPHEFEWQEGPTTGELGRIARIEVPEGFAFLGERDTQVLLRLMENLVSGAELGTVRPLADEDDWIVFFEFSDVGYVEDDERDELDADAMLKSIREGAKQSNRERRKRGYATMEVVGWARPPRYNKATNNLEWGVEFTSEGTPVVNYNTRLLGRRGVMEVSLVVDPEDLDAVLPAYQDVLKGFSYESGHQYGQFRSGDKIAEYGLTGLVVGGAAAVALKTGLLARFWKLIVAGFVAVAAFFRRLFGRGAAPVEGRSALDAGGPARAGGRHVVRRPAADEPERHDSEG